MSQEALISRLNELPRIESVLQELLEMVNRDNFDFSELSKKLAMDQVLSARLLRMANSAHFAGNKPLSNLNEAVIRVGSGAVRTLVSSSILYSAFPKIETLNIKDYWANTFEVAMIASKLADQAKLDANEVFTTGVLHNIGELMIHSLVPEQAIEISNKIAEGQSPLSAQREVLGTDATKLGAKLAEAWKFPPEMKDAIENINHPGKAKIAKRLACLLYLARDINKRWDSMLEEEEKQHYLAEHPAAAALGITPGRAFVIDQIRGQGSEMAYNMFS
ncbi:HDOD domain-containing protein [Vibrio vulnificus]|uniref:HDOD domain-containing protein n=1 Tax=Vibrio vulnificus TaxID=672 RepID=UPI00102D1651|nr:HDOD domain-containing protein [Vibrio vulnificus]EGR0789511.1 HDOD domain-containing protein [Vibrio vulnificus]EGR0798360.1 HDOD domain-containing protein [Vibrio vulnificus]EGR0815490.1 HDOD domain-containing protein [Vibrio vulnificus]EGR0826588.1 HDOD domain-containing protein [Vibrio vulnificus]EGR0847915.1 HDOD domain-containing protein [Vibrio vulnificus]